MRLRLDPCTTRGCRDNVVWLWTPLLRSPTLDLRFASSRTQDLQILHLIHSYPPESRGGTETYVQELAREQTVHGDRVVILAGQDQRHGSARIVRQKGGDLEVWRLGARARDGVVPDGIDREVARLYGEWLEPRCFDLVHLHHWHNLTSNLVQLSTQAGLGTVVSLHDHYASCPFFFRLNAEHEFCEASVTAKTCAACVAERYSATREICTAGLVARQARLRDELETAGACVALSRDQADLLSELPLFEDIAIDVLPLPVPTMVVGPRQVSRTPGPEFRIVSWGGLVRGKGMHLLLQACHLLPARRRIQVHHYGRILDEAYAEELTAMAGDVDLRLHGPYSRDQMDHEFANHDLAVFPSLFRETHGFVVDEAMLLGLPVLVSDRGAPKERLGDRGSTFAADSASSLAARLAEFMETPGTLEAMRRASPELGGTMQEHASSIEQIYRRVLNR